MDGVLNLSIVGGPVVVVVGALGALATIGMLVRPSRRWSWRRWAVVAVAAAVAGALIAALVSWLLIDVLDALGVEPTPVVRWWAILGTAGIGLGVAGLVRASAWRVAWSAAGIVLCVAVAAMAINIDFGQYPTVRSALGIGAYHQWTLPALAEPATRPALDAWTAPADLPARGAIGEVEIPGTASGFATRPAVVYLPPAALTSDPPLLPVWIVLSGQPGSPDAPLAAAGLRDQLDAYAAAHDGLAPIVVSPDQLGRASDNPMCVDGELGNSATYLTVDVVAWIRSHLPVLPDAADWAIGGMSQGGTCAAQLGPAHPELFGGVVDASGELAPSLGPLDRTIELGFGGDADAYRAATPLAIMASKAPLTGMIGVFGVGADDGAFREGIITLAAAAEQAGMTTSLHVWPGTAHDATAWGLTLGAGLDALGAAWGLDR